jgi:lipopolysaccharide transport system permease protein
MTNTYSLTNPFSPYRALARHFELIVQLARRDVADRYRGSFMGLFWSFANPLLMLFIYTFIFGVIFHARWKGQTGGGFSFALILFAGLNINSLFGECANRAPTLIIGNTNFVKKVVFPLEILSWSVVGSALFHLLISTLALLVIALFVNARIPWTVTLFPIIILVFLPFVAGVVWLLASFGVFLRDFKQAIVIITTALLYLAPILYPKELVPLKYRDLLYLNPLTVIVEASQNVLIWGKPPAWGQLGIYAVASSLFAWGAFVWFQRTRKGFADVL